MDGPQDGGWLGLQKFAEDRGWSLKARGQAFLVPLRPFGLAQKKEAKSSKLFSIWSNLQKKDTKTLSTNFST